MDLQLTDQVAFISGSSRGIGRAIAGAFLSEGARVVITGRDSGSLEQTERELGEAFGADRVLSFCGDLTRGEEVEVAVTRTLQQWERIDALVANLGQGRGTPGWTYASPEWEALLAVNLSGAVRLASAVLPSMEKRRQGSILFINSIAGLESSGAPLAYSAAKAGLLNYAKNLARQIAPLGVRVNTVAPGNIFFPGGSWEAHLKNNREAVLAQIEREVPMKRFGHPEEIARLAVFLSSPAASFVTGACLVADGGQTRG